MQKQKLIKVLKKQLFILGIWSLGVIAGASIINWYYLIPTLKVQTIYEQRGCVACDTMKDSRSEMTEGNSSDGEVVKNPKTGGESRLENDSLTVVKRVAKEEGVDWKLLWAVCQVESNCNPETVGDGGQSHGAFQIFTPAHPNVTLAQANDIEFSARWTANHGKIYKDNPNLFFKNHNGIGKNTNDWYVERCNQIYASL